jgi:hypothetical protein
MAKRATTDIEGEIDHLFQLPLAEFTAARNALSGRLKKDGRAEDADRIKGLQKPPATAWAVNQLQWRNRKDIEGLLAVGDRFRKAQAAQLAGKSADLRALLNERRDVLSDLVKRATDILQENGHAASPDAARRITTTLEALATWGTTPGAPQAGRLTDDIDPPGFEALAALVPRPGGGKSEAEVTRVLQFRQEERARKKAKKTAEDVAALRAKAREDLRAAEKALRDAQKEAEQAETALKKAAAAAKAAEQEKADIEVRYEKAQAAAHEAARDARRVAQEAEGAAQAVTEAEQAVERTRAALAEIEEE